jgi:glutamate-1-semialdehyde 2,1-aminomutase
VTPSTSSAPRTVPTQTPVAAAQTPRPTSWTFTDLDRKLAAEIQTRLPEQLFDAHAHLYDRSHLHLPAINPNNWFDQGPANGGMEVYLRQTDLQIGAGRWRGGLFFGFPTHHCDTATANRFVLDEIAPYPSSRALLLARPTDDPDALDKLLAHPQASGLKVYHHWSSHRPTFDATIETFLPEWMWQLCHKHHAAIMLHMVRTHALADEHNQHTIRTLCQRYPNVKLILAHAARGFNKWDTIQGVASLRGLDNVWFDTSGVCESEPFLAILREFGPRRLLWAGDFPITERRGKCVSVGDRFSWIDPPTIDQANPLGDPCPTLLVGLESTRAVLKSLDDFGASEQDRIDIFHDNAARLLNVIASEQNTGTQLYQHAKTLIPGGTQLLSKRPEMFLPDQWPAYFSRAQGCCTWDMDDKRYIDMTISGIGACLLGFADPDVTQAVIRRVTMGSMSSLNPPEEVELAELLIAMHPWAQQARFQRTGGEAMAVAVRIARATTGRQRVAFCGYHGWTDWYLAANLGNSDNLRGHLLPGLDPSGVPQALQGTATPFPYHDLSALQKLLEEQGSDIAAVIMEPMRNQVPEPGYLAAVRELAHRHGALLVFDEITIGFRLALGGAHLKLGVNPDLAIFAKALGNGHPIAAVIGTQAAMHGAHHAFLSSSYWTESVGPAAAVATLKKFQRIDVPAHLHRVGQRIASIWRQRAGQHQLPVKVTDSCPPLCSMAFDHEQGQAIRTLFTQAMLDQGFLAGPTVYATLAHNDDVLDQYDIAVDQAFLQIARALAEGDVTKALRGPVAHSGFRRLVS